MLSNSGRLALFLALSISVFSGLVLFLSQVIDGQGLLIASSVIFLTSSLAIYFTLQLQVFRQIDKLHHAVLKLRKGETPDDEDFSQASTEALNELHEELVSFAEKKQEEIDRLKKLETFRKEFIADVSHELKTPIFAAQGFIHTLLDGAVNDRAVRMKFLKKAARSLDGLDALVQDLMILSQIETGQIKMHFEEIDMFKLTEEVFEQFEEKVERKRITLRTEGSRRPALAYGDGLRLAQVMTNLVSNAIRHSFEDSDVVVSIEQTASHVVVAVRDSGEGIPLEHQHRIFERFYRVDKSRTKEKGKGGTGLGLAIVKHILEGHNSKADVESSPGHGSVFSFKLPRFKEENEADQ